MKRVLKSVMATVLAAVVFAPVLFSAARAEALEPKLLWEKEFKGKKLYVNYAEISGDVIVSSKNMREVLLYDKDGNEIFHWGPRLDRYPSTAKISANGKYFVLKTNYTQKYAFEKRIPEWSGSKLHFYERSGEMLWELETFGSPKISPDGSYIIVVYEGGFYALSRDGKNKMFSVKDDVSTSVSTFSSDSGYFAVIGKDKPNTILGLRMTIYDRNGNKIVEKLHNAWATSIADDAKYVATYPYENKIAPSKSNRGFVYDKNGDVVFEGSGFVSGDGTRVAMLMPDKTVIYSLPDKKAIKTLTVKAIDARISHDGRYLVLYGSRADASTESNLFIFDLNENEEWETIVDCYVFSFDGFKVANIDITSNGKYLIVDNFRNRVYFYQLY